MQNCEFESGEIVYDIIYKQCMQIVGQCFRHYYTAYELNSPRTYKTMHFVRPINLRKLTIEEKLRLL